MGSDRLRIPVILVVCVLAGTLVLPGAASAQTTIENSIKQFGGTNIKGYVQPVADLFGANMNSGYYHSAKVPHAGFGISLDIIAMGAMVGDDQKNFSATAPANFTPGTFQSPTIFGGKATEVSNTANPLLKYRLADGVFNTTMFPFAVPQLRVGYVAGTEALIRFVALPSLGNDQVPKVNLWGVGVRHSVSQYIPQVPVDIAAGFFYSKFSAGDLIDFTGISFGAEASKSFSVLTVYGGLGWENGKLHLTYTSTDPQSPGGVDVSIDGANSFRFTLGAGLSLGVFHLFADANFGSVTQFSGGIGFGI